MTSFAEATAVTRVADDEFAVDVDRVTWVIRGPNGGAIAAWLLRAMTERVGDPSRAPRSLTVHYPSSPDEGPATVHTTVEREGRSIAWLSARLVQDGKVRALALAAFSTPWEAPSYRPDPPALLAAAAASDSPGIPVERPPLPFLSLFEHRMEEPPAGWDVAAWMRPADGDLDAAVVAAMTDACVPTITLHSDVAFVVPTVDLTVHFRRSFPLPPAVAAAPVLGLLRSRTCAEGFWEEDSELWSPDGSLLAQSRQLSVLLGG